MGFFVPRTLMGLRALKGLRVLKGLGFWRDLVMVRFGIALVFVMKDFLLL